MFNVQIHYGIATCTDSGARNQEFSFNFAHTIHARKTDDAVLQRAALNTVGSGAWWTRKGLFLLISFAHAQSLLARHSKLPTIFKYAPININCVSRSGKARKKKDSQKMRTHWYKHFYISALLKTILWSFYLAVKQTRYD